MSRVVAGLFLAGALCSFVGVVLRSTASSVAHGRRLQGTAPTSYLPTGPCVDQAPAFHVYEKQTDTVLGKIMGFVFTDITFYGEDETVLVGCKDPQALYRFAANGRYRGGTMLKEFGEVDGVAYVNEGTVAVLEGTRNQIFFIDLRTAPHVLENGVTQVETIDIHGLNGQSSGMQFLAYDKRTDTFLTVLDNGVEPRLLRIDRFGKFTVVSADLIAMGIADITGIYVEPATGYVFINTPGTISKLTPKADIVLDETPAAMTPELEGMLGLTMDSNFTIWGVTEEDHMRGWTWTACDAVDSPAARAMQAAAARLEAPATSAADAEAAMETVQKMESNLAKAQVEENGALPGNKAAADAQTLMHQVVQEEEELEDTDPYDDDEPLPESAYTIMPSPEEAIAMYEAKKAREAKTQQIAAAAAAEEAARNRAKPSPTMQRSTPNANFAATDGGNAKPAGSGLSFPSMLGGVLVVGLVGMMALRARRRNEGSAAYSRVPRNEGDALEAEIGGGVDDDEFYGMDHDDFAHRADPSFTQASAFAGVGLS